MLDGWGVVNGTGNCLHGNVANNILRCLSGSDTMDGSAGDDTLYGGDDADTLYSGEGNEILYEDSGNGTLNGGNGNDHMNGGSGVDTLHGEVGDNVLRGYKLYGGDGNDRLSGDIMFGGAGSVRFFFTGEFGTDRFKEFRAGPGATDVIELSGFGGCWDSCAEVMASARQVGADTQLRFGKVNDVPRVIVLENMALSSLSADDFQFT